MALTPFFTPRFLRDIKFLDRRARDELDRVVTRILESPDSGKPRSYHFTVFLAFGHRKRVYGR